MELWERSEALSLLGDLLRESSHGGRIALVAGEAGIGKSALVNEFARRCGPGLASLWGACDRLVTPRALGPLHDIGHQIGGRLAARLRAAAPQEEIFAAFLDELSSPRTRRSQVVVVEDAHWADEATLDWLSFLGRRVDRLPALLFVTYRSDEVGPDHPLRGVLAALPSAVVRRVPLEPLSSDCVDEQARRAGRDGRVGLRARRRQPAAGHRAAEVEGAAGPRRGPGPHPRPDPGPAPGGPGARPARRGGAHAGRPLPGRRRPPSRWTCASPPGCWCPPATAWRTGTSSCAARWRTPCRRCGGRSCTGRCCGRWPTGRTSTRDGWCTTPGSPGDHEAVLRYGQVAGRAAARQGAHREAARHYRAAAAYAERLPDPEQAELLERYADEAHLAGANEEASAGPRSGRWPSGRGWARPSRSPRTCGGSPSCPGGPDGWPRCGRRRTARWRCWPACRRARPWPWPTSPRPSSGTG